MNTTLIYKACIFVTFFLKLKDYMITVNMKWLQLMGVVGSTVWFTSCGQKEQAAMPVGGYETMRVEVADKTVETGYSATIRGRQDINIMPQVSGTIQRLCVTEGEKVKKGQVLFIIDQVPYKAALNTAEANVKSANAALATAELTYNSNKELYANKVVSNFTLKTSENQYLTAKAQLAQAEAQEVNARNNLSYTEVKSPSNGVVGMLPYRVGALVGPTIAEPLTTVSDNSEMYVYFSMTENQVLDMVRQYGSVEDALTKMPEITLKLNDGTTYAEKGKIESISGVIDTQTGSVGVRAVFPNEKGLLLSGASGKVVIPATYNKYIIIPQEATVKQQDKISVFKVVDGKAVSTLIKVAAYNDGREYIVLEGLNTGDEIVAKGAGLLREGTQVK